MLSLICGIFKKKSNIKTEKKAGCQPLAGGENKRLLKGYKLSSVRQMKSEDLIYNIVTTVDNTVLFN